MSSIIFYTDSSQAIVATDTLAVTPDGDPLLFCSKAVYLPHIRSIIAGTGLGSFSNDWANHVNNQMVVKGISNLDYHTPPALRKRWKLATQVIDFPENVTTTVYQIGVSEDDEEIRAYAYRSTNDFESELLAHGTRVKPQCTFNSEKGFMQGLYPAMMEQRSIQSRKPKNERLYIGGACVVMHLNKEDCTTATVFEFDDYEEQLQNAFSSVKNT